MKFTLSLALAALLLSSCASLESSIGMGMGAGAMTGAIAGHSANFNIKGMALTTGTGMVIGGLLGLLLHKQPIRPNVSPLNPSRDGEPELEDAEKEVLWIPGKIESDRYTEPHRIFVIKRPSRWIPPPEKNDIGAAETNPGSKSQRPNQNKEKTSDR